MADKARALVVFAADLHVGSPFAVCPPHWTLYDGNPFVPNELQELIRGHWLACWQRVATLRVGARLIVIVVGDVTEGLHHETTQVVTSRIDTQEDMAVATLEEGLHLARWSLRRRDVLRFATGTRAHDGAGAASLERVARRVLDYAGDGRVSRDMLDFKVNGVRFGVAHKPGSGPGSRAQTQGNAFQGWLKSLYYASLEAKRQPPHYLVTAHHHQYLRRQVYSTTGEVVMTGVILPGWKVKDEYIYQVAPFALGCVGMYAVEVAGDGATTEHDWRLPVGQDTCEEL